MLLLLLHHFLHFNSNSSITHWDYSLKCFWVSIYFKFLLFFLFFFGLTKDCRWKCRIIVVWRLLFIFGLSLPMNASKVVKNVLASDNCPWLWLFPASILSCLRNCYLIWPGLLGKKRHSLLEEKQTQGVIEFQVHPCVLYTCKDLTLMWFMI